MKVIIEFSKLPLDYLNKYERFLRLFETSSLHGQGGLSRRQAKKSLSKLELPLEQLRRNLKLNQEKREHLLEELLLKKITYPQYR